MIKSPQFTLIQADWKSLGVGLLKTAIGAICTYLLANLSGINFGEYAVFAVPVVTQILNAIYKWATVSTYTK